MAAKLEHVANAQGSNGIIWATGKVWWQLAGGSPSHADLLATLQGELEPNPRHPQCFRWVGYGR